MDETENTIETADVQEAHDLTPTEVVEGEVSEPAPEPVVEEVTATEVVDQTHRDSEGALVINQ